MALYAIGDLHLCLGAQKPMDIFGSRWSGWDKKIISGWLSTVTEDAITFAQKLVENGVELHI